jgi:hypothetical protein
MNSLNINDYLSRLLSFCKSKSTSITDKERALDRLSTFPHKNINGIIVEAIMSIMTDDTIDITRRYNLIRNNKSYNKEIYTRIHTFCFNNYNPPRCDISFKINSARYLLLNCSRGEIQYRDITNFIYRTSNDNRTTSTIRSECKDILNRIGFVEEVKEEDEVNIQRMYEQQQRLLDREMVEPQRRKLVMRRTVYEDGQNVHQSSINDSVKETIKDLHKEYGSIISPNDRTRLLSEVSVRITTLKKRLNDPISVAQINGSFDRIMTDTSIFECNTTLADILIMIYYKIKNSQHVEELESRLIEELIEMNGKCATGHLSRLINVLSGFYEGVIKISFEEQIKNYIYNHYNRLLSTIDSDDLLSQIIEDDISKKNELMKVINNNSIELSLKTEFVDSGFVSSDDFTKWYKKSINSYCGIKE